MAVQEKHGSCTGEISTSEEILQSKEQFSSADECALKVRKPYTITKQRERWTEEEHEKFLEALKLHGRAWRKIEEHVGTKTAVQIRSHAQKFFSKVERDSNNGEGSNSKLVEIPPPRPKRKPIHPYPRKLGSLVKPTTSINEKLARSASQDMSEQETQSPTSVLYQDSSTPEGSSSPVLAVLALDPGTCCNTEVPTTTEPVQEDGKSSQDEEVSPKVELLSEVYDLAQEERSAVQCLKLFGKTLLVKDLSGASFSTTETCMAERVDKSEEDASFPLKVVPLQFPLEYVFVSSPIFNPETEAEKSNPDDASRSSVVPFAWLSLSSSSTQQVLNPTPVKPQLRQKRQNLDNTAENGASSSGSTADSDREKSSDNESCQNAKSSFVSRLSKRVYEDCRKGFVPYKRHSSSQEGNQEKEKPRSCICS